jgi:hypothetical protein
MKQFWAVALAGALASSVSARKFYNDDPLEREPAPIRVEKAKPRKLSDIYDLFHHLLKEPGEKHTLQRRVPAGDVNTLGEVLEGSWYEKRHARQRMSIEQLVAGPGNSNAPSEAGSWTILSAKSEGITPGFLFEDSRGVRYFLKFDPLSNPEMATAADVLSSKLFYALGYHVPENYIVWFDKSRLQIKPGAKFRDSRGRPQQLTWKDVNEILLKTPRDEDGRHRASASLLIKGDVLHAFRYYGTRADDPNDVVPHEHRRMLRGLHVFCAWLGHDDSRAINTLDALVEENGRRFVKHHLIDFGSTLGSASDKANSPRSGFEQFFTWGSSAKEFFSLGLFVPSWARVRYPDFPSVGRFTAQHFDPVNWTPEYPNPAFDNRLPEDTFWAATQVMAFTDDEIRAVVKTGRYTDLAAERYVIDTILARRDAVGGAYLSKPLSIGDFQLKGRQVVWTDYGVQHGYYKAPVYDLAWHTFDNGRERKARIPGAATASIPESSSDHVALDITTAGNEKRRVTIYLKQASGEFKLIGIDRVLD